MSPTDATSLPSDELHIWRAQLDDRRWPTAGRLPAEERDRAAGIRRAEARRRWVAARWALRDVLGRYLELEAAEIELHFGSRGKPMLAAPDPPLRFNLSHSGGLALVAISQEREVGVDVERLRERPVAFYESWVRREAVAKCLGTGLGVPLPRASVSVAEIDAQAGFVAAVAIAGDRLPALRQLALDAATASPARR